MEGIHTVEWRTVADYFYYYYYYYYHHYCYYNYYNAFNMFMRTYSHYPFYCMYRACSAPRITFCCTGVADLRNR